MFVCAIKFICAARTIRVRAHVKRCRVPFFSACKKPPIAIVYDDWRLFFQWIHFRESVYISPFGKWINLLLSFTLPLAASTHFSSLALFLPSVRMICMPSRSRLASSGVSPCTALQYGEETIGMLEIVNYLLSRSKAALARPSLSHLYGDLYAITKSDPLKRQMSRDQSIFSKADEKNAHSRTSFLWIVQKIGYNTVHKEEFFHF